MKILAIDSSGIVATTALLVDDEIRASYSIQYKRTHSETLLPMVESMLKSVDQDINEIDAISVASGPGSFTGLRIGAATAKGLCLALDKPLIAISTLEGLAYRFYGSDKIIVPLMDARREQVYTAAYKLTDEFETIIEPCAIGIDELLDKVSGFDENVIYMGDGSVRYKDVISSRLREGDIIAAIHLNVQDAAALAFRAKQMYEAGNFTNADHFAPEYLRMSQAERERKLKEKRG
ncbi:MAG: tRNA (adenosine(37)-N6)-threonylcarbamoyltransferase complex dimerization subunit type 1 TsaB [Lachnospiraceae bacterium]|nr:tRNA (adenosine(37)-N6)-threonylcarbamoyltransferase complex dimerization subunit type 1 TsaB [Lachnospiraceae bacterium]